jgi:hypothetical protein
MIGGPTDRPLHCRRAGRALPLFSPLAGEATLDAAGNVCFVHHYTDAADRIVEADIYVSYRRRAS